MKFTPASILVGLALVSWVVTAAPEIPPKHPAEQPGRDVETLIRELADESFRVREEATRQLWELGENVLPELQEAITSGDPEQVFRARDLLRKIQLHITPDTDPSVIDLVERYLKASPSEKVVLLGKMRDKQAWRQMLKLYASETQDQVLRRLSGSIHGIAIRAARERLFENDPAGAREYLEMAPADAKGLLALAEFHRSQGSLGAELERVRSAQGRKAAAWRLALERAAGNLQEARSAAEAAGEPHIAAAMAALSGDPLPWLRGMHGDAEEDERDPVGEAYVRVAVKRWLGEKVQAEDLEPLTDALASRSLRQSGAAMNSLFLLGQESLAEAAFIQASPLYAFSHLETLERIPEAFKILGLDPKAPDYKQWVVSRVGLLLTQDDENQQEPYTATEELVILADFLERRGLNQEAFDAYSEALADLAGKDVDVFCDLLGDLFGGGETQGGAPMLAKRIGALWAGDDDRRWEDLVAAAFGDDDASSAWWDLLGEIDPKTSRADQFDGMLALHGIGPDPSRLRDQWLARAWKAVEAAPAANRDRLVEQIYTLVSQIGDAANTLKAWNLLPEEARKQVFWGQRIILLSAVDRWDEAAATILEQIDELTEKNQPASAEVHAYAAAALRRAGREEEATRHDAWADKLALGSPLIAMRIGNGYAYGCDYKRAAEWWARAARESDPDSGEFVQAIGLHASALLEEEKWKEVASVSEVTARIYATSDYRWSNPLPFMRQRLQADTAHALDGLSRHRAQSIAILERCHQTFRTDGSLADFFFPALRKAGLREQHDRWFAQTWDSLEGVIRQYPGSNNTRNTAAWFAARARLKLDTARKYLATALAATPYQAAFLDSMAEIHFAMGQRNKAIEWSDQAVNFAPGDAQLRRQRERFRTEPLPRAE